MASFNVKSKKTKTGDQAGGKKNSFLKRGQDAKAAMQAADAQAEVAAEQANRMRRFFIPQEEEVTITFLDGNLNDEGFLDVPMFEEHNVQLGNRWQQIPCVADSEPCPLCEQGNRPRLVGVMTVINHSPYTIQSGPNAGKVLKNRRMLYVATRRTLKILNKLASKMSGLELQQFEVSRSDDKSPKVGDQFHSTGKVDFDELVQLMGEEDAVPADYDEEITFYTAAQMAELGVKKLDPMGSGSDAGSSMSSKL